MRWPPSYVQFETAGTDCSLHHIAQTRIPYQTGARLFSSTGGEHERQGVDKQCRARGTLSGWATRKMLRMRSICSSQAMFRKTMSISQVNPTHQKPSSFSPFVATHNSAVVAHVFGSVANWRTEGQDQMLLLLAGATIHGFRATCNCLARKQQVSRHRSDRLSVLRGRINRAPAMRRSLTSRRRLTRYDRWSVKLV